MRDGRCKVCKAIVPPGVTVCRCCEEVRIAKNLGISYGQLQGQRWETSQNAPSSERRNIPKVGICQFCGNAIIGAYRPQKRYCNDPLCVSERLKAERIRKKERQLEKMRREIEEYQ